MASSSSQASLSDLHDRINFVKQELDYLRERDKEYKVETMILEDGLLSLEKQVETEQQEKYRRQHTIT